MRIKTFLITFVCFALIVSCSAAIIFLQMQAMKGLRLGMLEDKLYTEDATILAWVMTNMDPASINPSGMPPSWGEIMVVDNETLTVTTSTSPSHQGMKLIQIPELLDQADPVIASISKSAPDTVRTKDYMIVLRPHAQGSTLIGLKPKAWEKGLLGDQGRQLQQGTSSAMHILIGFVVLGFGLSLILSLIVALVASSSVSSVAKAFEELSLGDFDADLPRSGGKLQVSLSDSFFRLKTSLKYSLERLGRG